MAGKAYKSIYYHIVFATKERQSFLTEEMREQVYHFIWNKCKRLEFYLHKIGGIEDHVHVLIYIPPKVAVADAIGQLKGSSSYHVNNELAGDEILYWHRGYGAITVSEENVDKVKGYIENQREHHGNDTIWAEYEEINFEE